MAARSATQASCEYCAGSAGESLRPWPRRSQVMTWREALSAARFGAHIEPDAA